MKTMMKSVAPILLGLLLGACGNSGSPTATLSNESEMVSVIEAEGETAQVESRQSTFIPPWSPNSTVDYYSKEGTKKIEPINIVIRGPVGTYNTVFSTSGLYSRSSFRGQWGVVGDRSNIFQCFNQEITFNGQLVRVMIADQVPGNILTFFNCGTGTRNHARVWVEETPATQFTPAYETIYIAASLETVEGAFAVPPPGFPATNPSNPNNLNILRAGDFYYRGITAPRVGIDCNNPSSTSGISANWKFTIALDPSSGTRENNFEYFYDNRRFGFWHNSILGCYPPNPTKWPMLVERNQSLSQSTGLNVFDVYVVPAYEHTDRHPYKDWTPFTMRFNPPILRGVKRCPTFAIHCLTEDTFNQGRDELYTELTAVLNSLMSTNPNFIYTTATYNVGNTDEINQQLFTFRGDGYIKVINIGSSGVNPQPIPTGCSTPGPIVQSTSRRIVCPGG